MKHIIYAESMEGVSVERIIRDSEYSMDTKHWHTECEIQYISGCQAKNKKKQL